MGLFLFIIGAFVGYVIRNWWLSHPTNPSPSLSPKTIIPIEIVYGDKEIKEWFFNGFRVTKSPYITPLTIRMYIQSWLNATYQIDPYEPPCRQCLDQIQNAVTARVAGQIQCLDLCIFEVIPRGEGVTSVINGQVIIK